MMPTAGLSRKGVIYDGHNADDRYGIMAAVRSPDMSSSMVISGSIVAVVGTIFLVTIDIAFIMMITFGVASVVLGLFLSRRPRTRCEDIPEGTKKD